MDARRILAIVTLVAITTAALAIPWLRLPYNKLDEALFSPPMLPGMVLLAAGTFFLVLSETLRARKALALMALCAPIADMILISRDTSIDPTTHNLMPFEIVMVAVWALMFIAPGMMLGVALRSWVRRQAG
jgi:hypothetical protein